MEITISKNKLVAFSIGTLIALIVSIVVVVLVFSRSNSASTDLLISAEECLPAYRDGGGPYYEPNSPFREKIVPEGNTGEVLIVEGKILNTSCTVIVADAVLDIWQASEEGEYEDEYYRGQVRTDQNGYYKFETVVPLGYGEGTAYRPPHIHFKVWIDGQEIVTSQMFFEDVRGRQGFSDQYIINLENKDNVWYGSHNIVLPDYL